jgi:hypothetical protein
MASQIPLALLCFSLASTRVIAQQATDAAKPSSSPLHPALIYTPDQVKTAIQRGQDAAKKGNSFADLLKPCRQNPRWSRGNGGTAHESFVWFVNQDALNLSAFVYNKAIHYESVEIPDEWKTKGAYARSLTFAVSLCSTPKVARWRWEHDRNADEGAVTVEKFVLDDGLGHYFEAQESTGGDVKSGQVNFSGTSPVTQFGTANTTSTATGSAFGSGGYAYGSATGHSSSTYTRTTYVSWSVERPYYEAGYTVTFDTMNPDGSPRFGPDVKQLILHVIVKSGELQATYTLPMPPPDKRKKG